MVNPRYAKAYKEIIEMLKYVNEEVNKISREMLEMFEANQDKNYDFKLDTKKILKKKI